MLDRCDTQHGHSILTISPFPCSQHPYRIISLWNTYTPRFGHKAHGQHIAFETLVSPGPRVVVWFESFYSLKWNKNKRRKKHISSDKRSTFVQVDSSHCTCWTSAPKGGGGRLSQWRRNRETCVQCAERLINRKAWQLYWPLPMSKPKSLKPKVYRDKEPSESHTLQHMYKQ